ncbi:methionine--tRNA ligase [Theileria orientalis]|uniref:methionine--tRNA ligase n=1 Tax=Theileria orientalis TaxID=68886 RepID=A0A976M4X7_THEOR|nr:methionine--tRNA ligase [Theileria orientalis]
MRKKFLDVYDCYDISPDILVHTSEDDHKNRVKHTFDILLKSDDIYRGLHQGYFSPIEDCYYTKSKLVSGKSPLGFDVEFIEEPAYFFRLNKWKDRLKDFFFRNPDSILPEHRLNEVNNILDSDLKDVAITRSNCDWGVEVAQGETIYVWFDALLGYLNHLKLGDTGYTPDNLKLIHVLGKDILSFHTLLWPAILMSLGLNPPCKFISHGWLLSRGDKISKSLNNSVPAMPPPQNSDVCRLALMNLGDFTNDFEFDPSIFESSHNIIRNKFANTCHRITSVISLSRIETIDSPFFDHSDLQNDQLIGSLLDKFGAYRKHLDDHVKSFRLDKYIQVLIEITYEINKFIEYKQFWLIDSHSKEFVATAWTACSLLFYLGLFLMPITPRLSRDIISRLRPSLSGNVVSTPSFDCLDNIIQYSYSPIHLNQLT